MRSGVRQTASARATPAACQPGPIGSRRAHDHRRAAVAPLPWTRTDRRAHRRRLAVHRLLPHRPQRRLARAEARHARERLGKPRFSGATFNEFVVEAKSWDLESPLTPGLALGEHYPELEGQLLVCVTELHDAKAIDALVSLLRPKA